MEFSVLDKQTLQCVMTEDEIADYGMDRKAIYQNDARAVDFFKQVMHRAQQETGFIKNGERIAVHAAFLSDESLEITFSTDPDTAQQTCANDEIRQKQQELEQKARQAEQIAAQMDTVILKSKSLTHMIDFCRKVPAKVKASLYHYHGVYFLLADVADFGVHDTAVLFYMADEYMEGICYTKTIAAFIEEHGKCVAKDCAVSVLHRIGGSGNI